MDTRTSNVFVWQNNLLKFYLENNIDKAIDFGHELRDDIGGHLQPAERQDLDFSLATAHSLKCEDLDMAIKLYNESLKTKSELQGIINNNLGISHFFKFV